MIRASTSWTEVAKFETLPLGLFPIDRNLSPESPLCLVVRGLVF